MAATANAHPPHSTAANKVSTAGTSLLSSFDTQHDDMIVHEPNTLSNSQHDAQLDYYGKRLATCSSDRTIRIHEIDSTLSTPTTQNLSATLKGHEGPVWQVAWAHPKYGHILATCSYDAKVLIWKQESSITTPWSILHEHRLHTASVNSIAWAPHEYGLMLACGSSDGKVSIISWRDDGTWALNADFVAHQIGCNSVSWSPSAQTSSLITVAGGGSSQSAGLNATKRLATAGSDNLIKIWKCSAEQWQTQTPDCVLEGHTDWVRDISWAPNIGLPCQYLASCSQDRTAIIWMQETEGGAWKKSFLKSDKFPEALWRVSWSVAGNLLAVSGGDNKITLWKQSLDGNWECVTEMEDAGDYHAAQ